MTRSSHALLGLLAALSAACAEAGPSVEITGQRTASRPSGLVRPNATPVQRFTEEALADEDRSSDDLDDLLEYDLPEGWRAVAPTKDRMLNLRPAGDPEAECYLSFLAADGGGLAQNVNRWRTQFGNEPLDAQAIAALPRLALLGREATLVEAEGTFSGMGSRSPRAGFRLLGLAVSEPTGSLFLKFTGPAPLVQQERERFLAFAASVRLADGHASRGADEPGEVHGPGDGHDHGEDEAHAEAELPADGPAASGLRWKAPAGWRRAAERFAREVTFTIGADGECYVTRLSGPAGGLRGNLDRWCSQVGRAALDEAAFEALPRIDVLGRPVPVLELEGTFTGMDGTPRPAQGLLAVAVIREHDSLFVKFTGPEELVRGERANFLAFAASLEEP